MKKHTLLTVLIALALVLTACGGKSDLAKHSDQWDKQAISHYRFDLTIGCFCAFRSLNPVSVEVQDGKIVSMIGSDGQPLSADIRSTFEPAATMEGLFALAGENLANADHVEIAYDATYGFPTSIYVDRIEQAADDEISYTVENFEVLK
jgi:hypothetical protein